MQRIRIATALLLLGALIASACSSGSTTRSRTVARRETPGSAPTARLWTRRCPPRRSTCSPSWPTTSTAPSQRWTASASGCGAIQGVRRRRHRAGRRLGRPDRRGPPPVIWSPASSRWGAGAQPAPGREGRGRRWRPRTRPRSCSRRWSSPCPNPWPRRSAGPTQPIGWADILALARTPEGWAAKGHPEWGPFRLGKTNPNFSTSGLSALIAQNYAATGKTDRAHHRGPRAAPRCSSTARTSSPRSCTTATSR